MLFSEHIGIAYSGAGSPTSPTEGIRVFSSREDSGLALVDPSDKRGWTRKELAEWLTAKLLGPSRVAVAVGHAFSFPEEFFRRMGIADWPAFLESFEQAWKTDSKSVEQGREEAGDWVALESELFNSSHKLRLCEKWTSSAKSVFHYKGPGSVYHSARAGLPWLAKIHGKAGGRAHFWPFDGFDVPDWKSLVAEVFPPMLRARYEKALPAEHAGNRQRTHILDAFSGASWLAEKDENGYIDDYLHLLLEPVEIETVKREGWILGVL
ncbi:MAG: hypothetical protein GXP49_17190 [Deltaproteobacteria bacterium]|nr:hypothetical protein [Deltaproteobacteria bacterium]